MQDDITGINVALLGYGYAGKTFHATLIAGVEGLNLTRVVSSDAKKVHADFPNVAVSQNSDDAFTNEEIQLVVIASPNSTHYDLAKRALNSGKHVVVDKPFTTTLSEAAELIELAEKKQKVLSVFQNRRWDGDFLTIRRVLDQGALGKVTHFESHFDRYRPEVKQRWREQPGAGGGLWYDLGPHLVDQAIQLFGIPEAIYADFAQQRQGATAVDYFHVILTYGSMRAVLHAGTLVPGETPRFSIHGTTGSFIKFGLDVQEDALKRGEIPGGADWGDDERDGTLTSWSTGEAHTTSIPSSPGNYLAYYERVRDAIAKGGPNPVTPEQALAVMQILELGCESSASGKRISIGAPVLHRSSGR